MRQYTRLFDFLSELIDIQIKKYITLAEQGINPDTRYNAVLVYEEVDELLEFAKILLNEIATNSMDDTLFDNVFSQVKFYLEQEHVRSTARWLFDGNSNHETSEAQISNQLKQLSEIHDLGNDFFILSQPVTDVQRRCQHDSYQIAYLILVMVKYARDNPDMTFDDNVPKEAQLTLERNAKNRYLQFTHEIDRLCQTCEDFLQSSDLQSVDSELSKGIAQSKASEHQLKLAALLQRYKTVNSTSEDSSKHSGDTAKHNEDNSEYDKDKLKTSTEELKRPKSSIFSSNMLFFGGMLIMGGTLLIPKLLPYFKQLRERDLAPIVKNR